MEKTCEICQNREFCKFYAMTFGANHQNCPYYRYRRSENLPKEYSLLTWIRQADLDELADFILASTDGCDWCTNKYTDMDCGFDLSRCKRHIKEYLLLDRKDLFQN